MKFNLFMFGLVMVTCMLSACSETTGKTPALSGNAPYTAAMPSPSNFQKNNAISASTMLPPTR